MRVYVINQRKEPLMPTSQRKARFLNRVKSKHKGWLVPSIENKIQAHFRIIEKVNQLLWEL